MQIQSDENNSKNTKTIDFKAKDLKFEFSKKGQLLDKYINYEIALKKMHYDDDVYYDEFLNKMCSEKKGIIDDKYINKMIVKASKRYKLDNEKLYMRALKYLSYKRSINPLQDKVKSLEWDGIPRVETIFIEFFNVIDTLYTREVSKIFFIGLIYRLLEPGCKFDYVLTLIGPQGIGKSTFFEALALDKNYFNSNIDLKSIEPKKTGELLQGKLIIEIAEISTKKADTNKIKSFLSSTVDEYRAPFDRLPKQLPRKCVFVATTNEIDGFLSDTTGNRRFLPLHCNTSKYKKLDKATVEQLYAETYNIYLAMKSNGNLPTLSTEIVDEAIEIQQEALISDPMEEPILDYLENRKNAQSINNKKAVCIMEIWDIVFKESKFRSIDAKFKKRIELVLFKKGYVKGGNNERITYNSTRHRCYIHDDKHIKNK